MEGLLPEATAIELEIVFLRMLFDCRQCIASGSFMVRLFGGITALIRISHLEADRSTTIYWAWKCRNRSYGREIG